MDINNITIQRARVHNLKNVSLKIPKNTLTVITGPSGSGKSSLAFDTIYVEGQRRYIESLSSYARQFLGQFQPPDVDSITGLSPSVAIDQKTLSKNPRSTVGTVTEIYDYMRVLYARVGTLISPTTGNEIKKYTPNQVAREILKHSGKKIFLIAPLGIIQKEDFKLEMNKFISLGYSRVRLNKNISELADLAKEKKPPTTEIDLVVDRFLAKEENLSRIIESVEVAFKYGNGRALVLVDEKDEYLFSNRYIDPKTLEVFPDLDPKLYSFNSPLGACPKCNGIGEVKAFNRSRMIGDTKAGVLDGALLPLKRKNSFLVKMVECVADQDGYDLSLPYNKLPKKFIDILFHGSTKEYTYSFTSENSTFKFIKPFPGIPQWLEKKYLESQSDKVKAELESYMDIDRCDLCQGKRLNRIALSTLIDKKNIIDLCDFSISEAFTFFKNLKLTGEKNVIAEKLLKEITNRLKFLIDVGLGYLTLSRQAGSLSGGEGQRIRLTTQIGSSLSGILYILDEPSIGLHQRDNEKLIQTLKSLRDLGNTIIVVEHDEETMMASDFIVDMGPKAGIYGGEVVATGSPQELLKNPQSLTAQYLSHKKQISIPEKRRSSQGLLKIKKANFNNLKNLNVDIPLGVICCLTGVSGAGKSTLTHRVLVPAIRNYLQSGSTTPISGDDDKSYHSIEGVEEIQSIIELDQAPIGKTPHSNPATYTGIFDDIRTVYSELPESKVKGYKPGRFSFNVRGGRCEECEGNGIKKIEMHFLPDVFVECDECHGTRYNSETLSIHFKTKNISDILNLSVSEAYEFFKNHGKIARTLDTLIAVGLGYIKLGQPATTLSGGEAQRLKLSRELSKRPKGKCLYILDEPTTGLHFEDINILLGAINKLVDLGHSVLIIEHNLNVIKVADYVIDLGNGQVIAQGTPEEVAKNKESFTGKFLKKELC